MWRGRALESIHVCECQIHHCPGWGYCISSTVPLKSLLFASSNHLCRSSGAARDSSNRLNGFAELKMAKMLRQHAMSRHWKMRGLESGKDIHVPCLVWRHRYHKTLHQDRDAAYVSCIAFELFGPMCCLHRIVLLSGTHSWHGHAHVPYTAAPLLAEPRSPGAA